MKTVTIQASKTYDIIIGSGLLQQTAAYVQEAVTLQTAVIISDSNVFPLHGQTVVNSFTDQGVRVLNYVFPAGEQSKNAATYLDILNFLAQNGVTRSDLIVALGGGVVGDMSGFVAATYLRGIHFVQIPTSLLAMVDSSVGGKTAIDLPSGKNLVGAFYQPEMVLCDLDTLQTLPQDIFRDGCAEVIKYAILFDAPLFDLLMKEGIAFPAEDVVYQCVCHKRDVVMMDEFESSYRQLLNLGHTLGHAVELCSDFSLSHGQSVAIGMIMITQAAASFEMCSKELVAKITSILDRFQLPCSCQFSAKSIYQAALSDKKRRGNAIHMIIPNKIGQCEISAIQIDQLLPFIKAGLLYGPDTVSP